MEPWLILSFLLLLFLIVLCFKCGEEEYSYFDFPLRGSRFDPEIIEKSGGMAGYSTFPIPEAYTEYPYYSPVYEPQSHYPWLYNYPVYYPQSLYYLGEEGYEDDYEEENYCSNCGGCKKCEYYGGEYDDDDDIDDFEAYTRDLLQWDDWRNVDYDFNPGYEIVN